MQVRLLGPLEVAGTNGPVPLGSAKERAVLAVLAVHAGEVVPEDRLLDALWGDDPPRTALKTLRSYVSRLRHALGEGGDDVSIETAPGGYRLRVGPDASDVSRVQDLRTQARDATERGDHAWAAVALTEAARLWRGRPLGDLADEPWALTHASRLAELRLVVLEERVDAELACGRHAALVAELDALCADQPLRERFWAQRMLALYRSGRQADALRVYQELRSTLADELGIDPSPDLQALERAVLAQDPTLAWEPPVAAAPSPLPAHGVELPAGVVTFLLTDIERSTALWEAHPKAMARALLRHDQIVADSVAATGGRIIKSKGEGDSTLSVFVRASDAAVAAVALQRALLAELWPDGICIRVRAALHTGEAEQRDGDYFGRPLNRAARLRGLASGGQILCSRASADLVADNLPDAVGMVELGPHELKDLARSEHVFALVHPELPEVVPRLPVTAVAPARIPLPDALRAADSQPFVGRHPERKMLSAAWEASRRGGRHTALIVGEPGIGKTRLASEFANAAFDDGAVVLYGRCDEDLGVAYQPFVEALRHYIVSCPIDVLESHAEAHGGNLARMVPEIARRLPDFPPPLQAEPEGERLRLFDAVVALLASASRSAPLVLVIDDLHWATKPTLLLLRHLVHSPEIMNLLVVGTFRDTEVGRSHPLAEMMGDLRRGSGVERLRLTGLDQPDVAAMIETITAAAADRDVTDLAVAVRAQTDGNPFFVREICRHLNDIGADRLDEVGLPEGIRDVVGRRLSRLSHAANRVLSVASVAGDEFELAIIERAVDDSDTWVLDAVDEALRAGLLVEVTGAAGRCRFAHSLIRQTLHDELSGPRRVRVHRQIGEAIEAEHGADLDAYISVLAHHFAEAAPDGQAAKAADYAVRAATQALEGLAFEQAVAYASAGLSVLEFDPRLFAARIALCLVLADAHTGLLDYEHAKGAAFDAAAEARRQGSTSDLARAARSAALAHPLGVMLAADPEVVALCEEALTAVSDGDRLLRAQLVAALSHYRSNINYRIGADAGAREAVAIARQVDDPETLCLALTSLVWALLEAGGPAEQLGVSGELIELGRRLGLPIHQSNGHVHRAASLLVTGDPAFRADVEEIDRLAHLTRSAFVTGQAILGRTLVATLEGHFDQAEAYATELLALGGQETSYIQGYFGQLFQIRSEQGRAAEFRDALVAAVADGTLPEGPVALAWVYTVCGEDDLGRDCLARVMAGEFAELRGEGAVARTLTLCMLSETAAMLGESDFAAWLWEQLAPRSGLMAAGACTICVGAVDRYLGMLETVLERCDDAEMHFDAALELEQRLDAPPLLARTRYWYARLLARRSLPGDRQRALRLLTQCRETAEALGMAGLASHAAALAEEASRPRLTNLPAPSSKIIGREAKLAETAAALAQSRITTLTGVGGVGKTRVALEVGARLIPKHRDGVWLVALAATLEPDAVIEVVAAALGVTQRQGQSLETSVLDFLRAKRLLLVLDNCEHLLDPVARLVTDVVQACPHVIVLATSREGLGVDGERIIAVPSLELPTADDNTDAEAVRLFIERATAANADFAVTAASRPAIARLCRRLDGIPLAIELAAARVRSLTPAELAERLDERFRLLGGGSRTAVERHQTLRRAVDWSYDLLTDEERRVFNRLAVFAGGFDLGAAEAVVGLDDIDRPDIVDLIARLVDKSLVLAEDRGGATRYRLLETIRQYAQEHLERSGEADAMHRRHAEHFTAFATEAGRGLRGPDEVAWTGRVEVELDNLRSALAWAVATEDPNLALRITAPLGFAGTAIGYAAGAWADRVLACPGAPSHPLFALVLAWSAYAAIAAGDVEQGHRAAHDALDIASEADLSDEAKCQLLYGVCGSLAMSGEHLEAGRLAERYVEAARSAGDDYHLAHALLTVALPYLSRDPARAITLLDEAITVARRLGNPTALAWPALTAGGSLVYRPDQREGLRLINEALDAALRVNNVLAIGIATTYLASLYGQRGDRLQATRYVVLAIDHFHRVGDRNALRTNLEHAAKAFGGIGGDRAAAVLLAARWPEVGSPAEHQQQLRELAEAVRSRLGDNEYDEWSATGATMDDDSLVEFIHHEAEALIAAVDSPPAPE